MKYKKPHEEQLARIKRLRDSLKDFEDKADSKFEDGIDAFTSFFIQCYHLSDWLTKSGFGADSVYSFIKSSNWLSLCRHLANTQKHQRRPKDVFIDFNDFSFGVSTPITRYVDHFKNGEVRFCIDAREFGPMPLDAMEFADQCIEEWESYLNNHPDPST